MLCYAPLYTEGSEKLANGKTKKVANPGPLPTSCPTQYQLVTSNLTGSPTSANGVAYDVGSDPNLEVYPSTTPTADAGKDRNKVVLLPGLPGSGVRYLLGPTKLTGRIVKSAQATLSTTQGWVVDVSLTGTGSKEWDNLASTYFHEIVGIELDGVVQSAPLTLPNATTFTSFDGSVQISGQFTQTSAQDLALALNYGTLPVRLTQLTSQTVTPTLGRSSLDAGSGPASRGSSWCCSTRSSITGCSASSS